MSIHFFGLLHLSPTETSAMNVAVKDFEDQVHTYIGNAICLASSLKSKGLEFTLLTNDIQLLKSINACESLDVKEINFSTKIPSGIKFYSAHFKVDVFRYLSTLESPYVALCDLDMVCLSPMPVSLIGAINNKIPLIYEISDQVIPAHGHSSIIADMQAVTGVMSEGRWIGGEFIAGPPSFFQILTDEIDDLIPSYLDRIAKMHHVGDEAYTSCAIERMRQKGISVSEAGLVGIVGRYWNADVRHYQRPWDYFKTCFLVHLPADKIFLAQAGVNSFSDRYSGNFIETYERHLKGEKTKRLIRKLIQFYRN